MGRSARPVGFRGRFEILRGHSISDLISKRNLMVKYRNDECTGIQTKVALLT